MNKENGKQLIRYKGYSYYQNNPALTIHEAVRKILVECGFLELSLENLIVFWFIKECRRVISQIKHYKSLENKL